MVGRVFGTLHGKRLLVIILFISIFTMAVHEVTNTDLWWHLATGKYIWETRSIPRYDFFSHTALGHRWINHSWLSQVAIYLSYRALGFGGLAFLTATIITVVFFLTFLTSSGHLYIRVFVTLLGAFASAITWEMRPHLFSFLLAALFLFILFLYKECQRNYLFLLPLLMVLWANSHSGYIAGLILVGIPLVGEGTKRLFGSAEERIEARRWRELLIWGALSLAVVVLNPNTYHLYLYPFQTASIGPLKYLSEWASPDFHLLQFHPFIWMLLLSMVAFGFSAKRIDVTDLLYLLVFGYMSLLAARNISLFALVATPIVAKYGSLAWHSWRGGEEPPTGFHLREWQLPLNWFILLLVLAGCIVKAGPAFTASANLAAQKRALPYEAADFLARNDLPPELFNSYNWGGFLIWRLHPQYRVFIDGRTDLYGEEVLTEYLKAYWASPQWREPLERYDVNSIIIERDSTFATLLAESPNWQEVYADELAVVFVRKP